MLVLHFQSLFVFLVLFLFRIVVGISHGFFLLLVPWSLGFAGSHAHLLGLGLLGFTGLRLGGRKTKRIDYATFLWGLGIGWVELAAGFQVVPERFDDHLLVLSLEVFVLFLHLRLLLLFGYLVNQPNFVIQVLLNFVRLIMLAILLGLAELAIHQLIEAKLAMHQLIGAEEVREYWFKHQVC